MSDERPDSHETDPIAEALRQAGPREPLPPLDLEALAGPARRAWEAQVEDRQRRLHRHQRRQRQRLGLLAAAAVALLALGTWYFARSTPELPVGVVIARAGQAAEPGSALQPGAELWAGQPLVTAAGPGEWLTVELASGHRLRLDAGTTLRIDSPSRIELEAGRVYVEAAPAELRVRAAGAVVEHLGTSYVVSVAQGRLGVRVRHGRVKVVKGDQKVELGRGRELSEANGELEVRAAPTHGQAWTWTRRAAPPFDSDGVELGRFLEWIEAETGWQVQVDPELLLDDEGQPIRIRGTVDDTDPETALEAVLVVGAGLRHRLDGDRLRIEAAEPVDERP